ncbi:type IV prepilin peptidase [Candidatus Mancarchaeum acidiphilum]|uniref:Type IV prepilin peptidase n=1 Tax=Candidatus Mancarchaeum acidiphilum TaxID=1920749 RepID=A0A218NN43_9ARCH|nr:hypothetical protein [Candidatus Mancarchaeum acidiphilum]ASI13879.1 type IV prepilin peptidase [Candidatus Mancarchaeum acidiphilum]
MILYDLRIASILVISFAYMLFDLFNKRNVPDLFVYATTAYAIALTIIYFNYTTIAVSLLIAAVIFGAGYLLYKYGQLGAADVFELAAISLMLPYQPSVILNFPQYNFPFIFSILINAGIMALVIMPIYYLPKYSSRFGSILKAKTSKSDIFKASMFLIVYVLFYGFLVLHFGFHIITLAIILVLAVFSFLLLMFEKQIMRAMIRDVNISDLEEGDMIATNLMSDEDLDRLSKLKSFGRLVTGKSISELKESGFNEKLPVYKDAFPFALPIFLGVAIALLAGNLILALLA